jgi:hypothetical protein
MRLIRLSALVIAAVFAQGCHQADGQRKERDGFGPGELKRWNDPNYAILAVRSYNYTNHDIYGVYILPVDQTDIEYAGTATGGRAVPKSSSAWEMEGSGPGFAWDRRWTSPIQLKLWWHKIVDAELSKKSGAYPKGGGMFDPYDPYTTKMTRPGEAWCESIVQVSEKFGEPFGPEFPNRRRRELVLHFFPDGTVSAHLEFGADSDVPRPDITQRDSLPVLKDRACLKEVANPLYGKKRPLSIN